LEVDTVRREFPDPPGDRVTLVGFRDTVGPFAITGEMVDVRFTTPENPLTLDIARLETADVP